MEQKRGHWTDSTLLSITHTRKLNLLNWLHRKLERFYRKFSSPGHIDSDFKRVSTLLTIKNDCHESTINTSFKPDFQSVHVESLTAKSLKKTS